MSDDALSGAHGGTEVGYVEIYQDRDWFGDPRMAVFTVYVDGSRAGSVALKSSIRLSLSPGIHRLRIRQWFFSSPDVPINVGPGQVIRLKADVPRQLPFPRRFLRMLAFSDALSLEPVGPDSLR